MTESRDALRSRTATVKRGLPRMIAEAPALQEVIARAIFEERYKKSWDRAKEADQWLAKGSWDEAAAVLRALPLAVGRIQNG